MKIEEELLLREVGKALAEIKKANKDLPIEVAYRGWELYIHADKREPTRFFVTLQVKYIDGNGVEKIYKIGM